MPKLTFLGHSGWLLESPKASVVIDPFLEGNPLAKHKASDLNADYILISHAHGDHISDVESIAKNCKSTIIANFEIATYYGAKGIETHPLHIGGGNNFPFGRVKLTPAFHGSSFPDGTYGGMPAGILLTIDDKTFYHTGDTGLFSDMQLIGKHNLVDVMMVCIGDNFTMGIDDAVEAVDLVKPRLTVPMHYKTFPMIDVDPEEFASKSFSYGNEVKIMDIGDSFNL
ncbi:MAG: metal-dependent hydrolase [Calditrichaeota bacterium]|nr:MAG: metal-dependent hydrolase [Calditrichota bacterium]MBL1206723.1 metal-dependent hydrolase [Calditrichota bacterium]NOG46549.1 metal-dependent hydrolase [Calditrichota bacterium]